MLCMAEENGKELYEYALANGAVKEMIHRIVALQYCLVCFVSIIVHVQTMNSFYSFGRADGFIRSIEPKVLFSNYQTYISVLSILLMHRHAKKEKSAIGGILTRSKHQPFGFLLWGVCFAVSSNFSYYTKISNSLLSLYFIVFSIIAVASVPILFLYQMPSKQLARVLIAGMVGPCTIAFLTYLSVSYINSLAQIKANNILK
ncbi:hypothetical protein NEMIN01_1564 [Nematocida minor]|uniref:uncharacterized protein n=1 Tax=Nematocida minor TaxID=1912983 RepID=UPI002220EB1E|nr:uncharacterized protein NEMIN01_1564 [Nematocida minor]KAI5191538.1 hypothetical protein NEMIN01_1564 [Nematocida minor]